MKDITVQQVIDHDEFSFDGDFDLVGLVEQYISDEDAEMVDTCFLNDKLDYDGSLSEAVDNMIDVYYHSLRKWAVDNWDKVEEAMKEGLTGGVTDYHQLIQAGQYVHYRAQMQEELEEFVTEFERVLDTINR